MENPSAAGVARELGISKQASAAMQGRIVSKLLSTMQRHAEETAADFALDKVASEKAAHIQARPEYLEISERRGKLRRLHFQAFGGFDERLGRETVSGYHIREVSEAEAAELEARGIPVVRRRWKINKESPGTRYWIEMARGLARAQGVNYKEALLTLYRENARRRPPAAKGSGRCRRCGCPLPWGETIPGSGMGRVSGAREICSNFCKVTTKRARPQK
jgi:hypothetical protein